MTNPFPGMNPWLEHPSLWGDVHFRLISAIARSLGPRVRPRYYVSVGTQTYIAPPFTQPSAVRYPDIAVVRTPISSAGPQPSIHACVARVVEPITVQVPIPDFIEETYLEVYDAETGQVITVIEVLSPTNKRPGIGRQKYERKRLEILSTPTNLVEVDLLRAWEPMPFTGDAPHSHYRILVRRGEKGSDADLYPFNLQDPIPEFPLPLQVGDAEPLINLNTLLDDVYVEGNYEMRVNYHHVPKPPLTEGETEWARGIIVNNKEDVNNPSS